MPRIEPHDDRRAGDNEGDQEDEPENSFGIQRELIAALAAGQWRRSSTPTSSLSKDSPSPPPDQAKASLDVDSENGHSRGGWRNLDKVDDSFSRGVDEGRLQAMKEQSASIEAREAALQQHAAKAEAVSLNNVESYAAHVQKKHLRGDLKQGKATCEKERDNAVECLAARKVSDHIACASKVDQFYQCSMTSARR